MKILKYFFLLFLLSLVTLSIFIATQKGEFAVERSKIINSQRAFVFNYVNDLKNWKDWNSLGANDAMTNINYSNNTIGNGGFCNWDGKEGAGELKTLNVKENDSIRQKMILDGNTAEVILKFKDTLGKTKVTWTAKGKMSFTTKILTFFNGGGTTLFGTIFENSLANLDKKLDYEINTYQVKVNGVVRKLDAFYLSQTFTSEFSKINKNTSIVFSKINTFCKNNTITIFGKPFVIYHTYDTANELAKISICIPIKEPIFITEGSEILSDTLHAFDAVKTTLKGDYSHKVKALDKTVAYFKTNNLKTDSKFSHIEIYTIGKNETHNPSKWITEIYYPTKPKPIYKPAVVAPLATEETTPIPAEEKEIPSEF